MNEMNIKINSHINVTYLVATTMVIANTVTQRSSAVVSCHRRS